MERIGEVRRPICTNVHFQIEEQARCSLHSRTHPSFKKREEMILNPRAHWVPARITNEDVPLVSHAVDMRTTNV
jgi:hypothetical protein